MGNRLPRLVFDVDGVLADFQSGLLGLMNRRFGTSYSKEQWTKYHIGESDNPGVPFTKAEWDAAWVDLSNTPFFWANLDECPNVDFAALEIEMATFQYNGYFITRRKNLDTVELGDANALTRIWFEKRGVESATSIIATENSERIPLLKLISPTAYLEDWGDQFVEARREGINAYLIDRPYNQEVDTPFRVRSVRQFVNLALGREVEVTRNDKVISIASA